MKKLVNLEAEIIKQAVSVLRRGKAVVFPTDTSYGLAVDATNPKAVRKLYQIKGRSFKKPIHIVVNSISEARKFVEISNSARKLAKKFLPGPLTLVLPLRENLKNRTLWKLLTAGTGALGIRIPDHELALLLVRKLKKPITATSANVSGKKAAYSIEEIEAQFSHRKIQPDLVIDVGKLKPVRPSTIVDLTGQSVKILRQGPITLKEINQVLSFRT